MYAPDIASTVGSTPSPTLAVSAPPVACAHCGLTVPRGVVEPGEARQFCCVGCRTAFTLLHEGGLEGYYELPERREKRVSTTGRSFGEFDHPAFQDLYVRKLGDGRSRVELYLEGVHCASCVWLVERVPLLIPGLARAELDVRRSRAVIEWDPQSVPLSRVAQVLDSLGYTPHPFRGARRDELRRHEDRRSLADLGIAGALAVNVMLASLALYSGWWTGMEASYERFFRWVSLALTAPAVFGPGRVFFTSAWAAVRTRTMHMDLPIAIALAAGVTRGAVNTVTDAGPIYLDGVAMLVFLLLCGRYLQQRGQRAASDAAELLYSLTPRTARLVTGDGSTQEVPAEAVLPNHIVVVRGGETLPADGIVEEGQSVVDVALLTGESQPEGVTAGSEVFAGTLNIASTIRVRVMASGEESRVARLMRQVESGARQRAPVVLLADRMAGWFTAAVIVLAAIAWFMWLQRDPTRATDIAIALLVVTCPCALALATPLAVSMAIGRAARAGIFVKSGAALETLARPTTLFLDKTGTLTQGRMTVVTWTGDERAKAFVAAVERDASHPIGSAFRNAFAGVPRLSVKDTRYVVGGGVEGVVCGRRVAVGSPPFVSDRLRADREASLAAGSRARGAPLVARDSGPLRRIEPPLDVLDDGATWVDPTLTPVWVAIDGRLVAVAGVGDAVRPDTAPTLRALRARGWRTQILSGDDPRVVQTTGALLGFGPTECHGGLSPEHKLAAVTRARESGPVVMVGDGVNDAAAMAAASVGIGVHGGAEASLATADVYLTRPGLRSLAALTDGSRRTMGIIRRGMLFSLVYNVAGTWLALTGAITPLAAAVLMPVSSLTVLVAAWRGRSFDPEDA